MQAAPLNEFRLNWVVEVIEAGTLVVWSDFCLISGETLSVQGSRFDFSEEKSLSTLVDSDGHIDIDNDLVLRSNTSRAVRALSYVADPLRCCPKFDCHFNC